jgi:hypothetical protein
MSGRIRAPCAWVVAEGSVGRSATIRRLRALLFHLFLRLFFSLEQGRAELRFPSPPILRRPWSRSPSAGWTWSWSGTRSRISFFGASRSSSSARCFATASPRGIASTSQPWPWPSWSPPPPSSSATAATAAQSPSRSSAFARRSGRCSSCPQLG